MCVCDRSGFESNCYHGQQIDFQIIFRIGRIMKYVVVTQAKKRVCRSHDALASKKATWYVLIRFFSVPNEQKKVWKKYDRI